jgi:predicted dehydrogenase
MPAYKRTSGLTRRHFLKGTVAAGATFTIVPCHVLGQGQTPPSETLGGALIGVGGRGPGTFSEMVNSCKGVGLKVEKLAECDVRWVGKADDKLRYTDFRRVLERKDIDVVAIGTPPHWHALISMAAMEAGKDVLCEKPMTRFIGEARAVAETEKRYGRIFQIGTFGRFGQSKNPQSILTRKIMTSGFLNPCPGVAIRRAGHKVKEWSGLVNAKPQPVPANLDWDMYCGPSPIKAYHPHRVGGTHRGYWDYEGGGLCDMGQHALDPLLWTWGKDITGPVEAEAFCPPAHHEAVGMWAWVELKYADGFTLVFDSAEWGENWDKKQGRGISLDDLSPENREKIKAMPDPAPLLTFGEAVRARKPAGGNATAAFHTITAIHLMNLAIRIGRKLHFDPEKDQIIGDEQANRLVNPPMRAPWHI